MANFLIDLLFSDYWLWFLISVVLNIFFIPSGIFGWITFFKWFNKTFIMPSKGYIIVRQFLPNEREIETYKIPTGKFVEVADVEGNSRKAPIRLDKGWVKYLGNTPVVEYDENGLQRPLGKGSNTLISQEETTRGMKASYDAGKLIGGFDIFDMLKKLLIVMAIVFIGIACVGAYFSYSTNQVISKLKFPSAQDIAQAMISYQQNQTVSGNQIPTAK